MSISEAEKTMTTRLDVDSENISFEEEAEAVDERKTLRFVDFRILPLLGVIYAFALIDRINLGSARVAGMGTDLQLQIGDRYSIASCLYFVPYIPLQIPGNAMLRMVGVRNWVTFIVLGWGAVQLGMAFVKHWGLLTLCRTLLGAFEAGFLPAMVFVISTWYKRHEVHKRLAVFDLIAVTISGFSPILAYAFSLLNGKRGIAGWSWIFIIEGAITIALGFLAFFYIPDFPDRNTFLSKAQTAFILRRIEQDCGDSRPDEITTRKILHHLGDWTIWAYGIMFACSTLPAYMLAFFIPIILKGMNYSTTASLLLSAPVYGPAVISAMIFAWLSDKFKHRSGFIAIQALITLVGCCMTAFAKTGATRYAGTFFISAGASGCIPSVEAYGANNVVSHSKRAVQSALTVAWGGIGGIIASTVFREKDSPKYIPGLWVTIGAQIIMILLSGVTYLHFRRMNRLAREGHLSVPLEGKEGFLYTT
ncbi:MFS general substrate transporter [Marasmius fiardii PR-910]|nr:MFS general substrate transporter [Marasmius fiardii PR-910]